MQLATILSILLFIAGCASPAVLMPTPNLYKGSDTYPRDAVDQSYQNNRIEILYLTDRAVESSTDESIQYGSERSSSLAFGTAEVEVGQDWSWQDVLSLDRMGVPPEEARLRMGAVQELGRYPPTPYRFSMDNGSIVLDSDTVQSLEQQSSVLHREIRQRLAKSKSKNVVLFVHGFNNTFEKAVFTLSGLWHYLGRQGVPIAYSWPAAHGGLLGYFVDRESGEFTVYHLKQAIKQLAALEDIEQISIISHSRGTDVTTTALRELIIESRASGRDPKQQFRIANLVLAAPDLDFGVIGQRLIAEQFALAFGQVTIYTTQADKALSISQRLMTGVRFGRIQETDLDEDLRDIFSTVANVHFIEADTVVDSVGHNYFYSNPAVSSDLLRVISTGASPGGSLRPLKNRSGNFWTVPEGYPELSP